MDLVIRAVVIYCLVLVLLRASGKRQFSEISTFDFVLLLVVSEAISQPIFGGEDFSLTAAVILVGTLVSVDVLLSYVKRWIKPLDDIIESVPVLLVDNGRLVESSLSLERVDVEDILETARRNFGVETLAQVKYAILERNGAISVIPRDLPWGIKD